ncbi:glycerophosphodiester phosphodiesterase family protein [Daejeonella lutea]|uniref:Glycerophosphoryl diester phosphodiesterase n=1 Tax=Daejeonella lutea TaxID=572036 RepID=A0A1T5EHN6_9SPHI|nr:glycerophosphodiester phosphodiesterase family protein [Daejeonella lutea]SKB83532.1 glycerophosphoryl diester phosphodiesterase [Daejeonella lutea]
MKSVSNLIIYSAFLFLILPPRAFSQRKTINIFKINNSQQLIDYFRYTGNDLPIVSGHRGGNTKGYPENCIPTLENTLKYTPAFFEIDPRLTKDGYVVLMHDATLDRTTTGKGKVSDYTYAELQQFRLKDPEGNVTPYAIPLLLDVIKWSKGKTVLNLDHKDVPLELTEKIVKESGNEVIMYTVHNPDQAKYYLKSNPKAMFSVHILTRKAFDDYDKAGIPWQNMIAYIGSKNKPENKELLDLLHAKGVMCMISAAPSYDKLTDNNERASNYRDTFKQGADILESDLPVEVAAAIKSLDVKKSPKRKYHSTLKVK